MRKSDLVNKAPTAQVRLLTEELLRDGQMHTRQEIVAYVREQGQLLELPIFRKGHISGGIRQAVSVPYCVQVARATYCLGSENGGASVAQKPRLERAADVCADTVNEVKRLAREIDYITSSEMEMRELTLLRECAVTIQKLEVKLRRG